MVTLREDLLISEQKIFHRRKQSTLKRDWDTTLELLSILIFIGYEGGKLDWLGFDDGGRGLPISPTTQIPHPSLGSDATQVATSAFGSTMATQQAFSFLNQNYSFAMGNLKKVLKKDSTLRFKYGYNVALNYRTQNNYFGDVQYNEYIRAQEFDDYDLFRDRSSSGELATSDVRWTGLLGQSILKGRSKIHIEISSTRKMEQTQRPIFAKKISRVIKQYW